MCTFSIYSDISSGWRNKVFSKKVNWVQVGCMSLITVVGFVLGYICSSCQEIPTQPGLRIYQVIFALDAEKRLCKNNERLLIAIDNASGKERPGRAICADPSTAPAVAP